MKIVIEEPKEGEEDQIILKCKSINNEIMQLISSIKIRNETIIGYDGDRIHRISPVNIYYFEAVDNKVFLYCKEKVYESKQKLYEIEEAFVGSDFLRASKSVILNMKKIKYLSPAFSGRLEATLDSGEKVIISRQYVPDLKKKLKI